MLFARGIMYCLKEIQDSLNIDLGVSDGLDYETVLLENFQEVLVTDNSARMPKNNTDSNNDLLNDLSKMLVKGDSQSSDAIEDKPETDIKKGKSFSPKEMLEKLIVPKLNEELKTFLEEFSFNNETKEKLALDKRRLRLNCNWADLVKATYDQFVYHLNNTLSKEALFLVKRIILVRYARYLNNIKNDGLDMLTARAEYLEKLDNEKDKEACQQAFKKNSVDGWMFARCAIAKSEALSLLEEANKLHSGSSGVSIVHGTGYTEDLVNSCHRVLQNLKQFMQSHDDSKTEIQMQDYTKKAESSRDMINITYQNILSYFFKNWFENQQYQEHSQRGAYSSDRLTYKPSKALEKRKKAKTLLDKLEDIAKTADKEELWQKAIEELHINAISAAEIQSYKPGWLLYLGAIKKEEYPQMLKTLHNEFVKQADTETKDVTTNHQNCKF